MTWYVAHAVFSVRLRSGKQKKLLIEENIYLLEAEPGEDAMTKAIAIAKANLVDDATEMLNDKPAFTHFEGIRKIISISNPVERSDLDPCLDPPVTGTELSYEHLSLSEAQLKRYLRGERVHMLCHNR